MEHDTPKGPDSRGDVFVVRTSNPSKTSEKMGYFDRVTVSLHILYTANQETEGSQDRLTGMLFLVEQAFEGRDEKRAPLKMPAWEAISKVVLREIKYCFQSSW